MKKFIIISCIALVTLLSFIGCSSSISTKDISKLYSTSQGSRYIVVIEVKQSHLSFDLSKHVKDAMNKVEIAIPVDEQFYDDVRKGDKLSSDFRMGSLLTSGSVGSWDITVKDKLILE
ncbi:hypothetical protein [Niameybacter massiliensis]|uniref:hypothetical protein n=1 Tax=Niameybacter massiliensis TaxID=1658108 RepID=UPI0006B59A49|nr:hypothetical protein [Niameybacter massiliensis]